MRINENQFLVLFFSSGALTRALTLGVNWDWIRVQFETLHWRYLEACDAKARVYSQSDHAKCYLINLCRCLFLLLIIYKLDVVRGYLLVLLQNELLQLVANIALHYDFLAPTRKLGH